MKKRLFFGVIFAMLITSVLAFTASARSTTAKGKCGDTINWTLYSDGEMVIDGTGVMYDYTYLIVAEDPMYSVWQTLDRPWKKYESKILKVTISTGVENVGINAFLDCKKLKTVVIQHGVKEIKASAFSNCTSLTDVVLPQGLVTIEGMAFNGCVELAEVNIPDSVTTLGNEAFINCRSLVKITMPDDIENMGYSIFSWRSDNGLYGKCGAYAYWSINNDVLTISGYGKLDDYTSANGGLYFIPSPWNKNEIVDNIKKVIVNDGITYIGNDFFDRMWNVSEIYIGNGVKTIHNFWGSSYPALKTVYIGDSIESIGRTSDTFNELYNLFGSAESIVFTGENPKYYMSENRVLFSTDGTKLVAYPPKSEIRSYSIPEGITTLCADAFADCYNLRTVYLPKSLKYIGRGAFSNDRLTSIVIPNNVEIIGEYAFGYCELTTVTIGFGVNKIEEGAFAGTALKRVYYNGTKEDWEKIDICYTDKNGKATNEKLKNANITFLGRPAPEVIHAGNLTATAIWQLYDNGKLTITGTGAIQNFEAGKSPWYAYADKITAIEISDGITGIGACAFYGCANVYGISLPASITSIGYAAFFGCKGISGFIVPQNVTAIGDYAFFGCTGLTYVTLYPGVAYIGAHAFDGCTGLERINLPDTITYIGDYAFSGCLKLAEIVIPVGLTEIRPYVFNMCTGLVKVVIHSKVEKIDYTSFCGCKCHIHGYSGTYAQIYADSLGFAFVSLKFVWSSNSEWGTPELKKADEIKLFPETLKEKDLSQSITREEFAAIAVKVYENLTGIQALPAIENPFADTNNIDVLKAFNLGITTGVSETQFAPNSLLTREQAATMLTRVFKKATIPGWTVETDGDHPLTYTVPDAYWDHANISGWAVESVYFMTANGIINGVGGNMFAPKNTTTDEEAKGYANATREQALIIAVRMAEKFADR